MIWRILEYLLRRAGLRAWTSTTPEGRRLGGHDIPQLADMYLIIEIKFAGHLILFGYLQYT